MDKQFLVPATVFDDRTILTWSLIVDGETCPRQHVGLASEKTWTDTMDGILEGDRVRICVTDRRAA